MKRLLLLLMAATALFSVGFMAGCSEGPPKDNKNVKVPPAPPPPGGPG